MLCLRFLFYWKAAFETGFDNRMRQRFSNRPPYGSTRGNKEPSQARPLQVLLDGEIERWDEFLVCRNVVVDFDKCRLPNQEKAACNFEEGFIRIGDRVSPSSKNTLTCDFSQWRRTREPPPVAAEFAPGKTALFLDTYPYILNIALMVRFFLRALYAFERAGIPEDDGLLIFPARRENDLRRTLSGEFWAFANGLFSTEKIGGGVFLFRRMVFIEPTKGFRGWQRVDLNASLRRRALASFGIEPREIVRDVDRITLISRQDYRKPIGGVVSLHRKISNEDEIVAALRERFPDMEITKTALESLPMKEQLSLIHRTDILVGMHGAAFGFCPMLPPNAGVLELLPACFIYQHWVNAFYRLVVNNQCHYQRWINLNPRREFSSDAYARNWLEKKAELRSRGEFMSRPSMPRRDFTEVPPSVVVRRVEILRRQIRKAAHSAA